MTWLPSISFESTSVSFKMNTLSGLYAWIKLLSDRLTLGRLREPALTSIAVSFSAVRMIKSTSAPELDLQNNIVSSKGFVCLHNSVKTRFSVRAPRSAR